MEPVSVTPRQGSLDSVRQRRAELRESMSELEYALAAPLAGMQQRWQGRVRAALDDLSAAFAAHVEITEGPDGLYQEILTKAPRLSGPVAHLAEEHARIAALLEAAQEAVAGPRPDLERAREQGSELLGRLVRHRQRGSDLVYEAYDVDIGGET